MPNVELPQAEFKVCMLGHTNVGKTSLVLRFANGYYRHGGTSSTVGAFFITKRIQTSDGITCKVQIWDTAGQPKFRPMAPMYYKSAAAVIVCYDATNPKSYDVMMQWLKELRHAASAGDIVIAIASTKSDLIIDNDYDNNGTSGEISVDSDRNRKIIPKDEVEALAATIGAVYVDTSAKNNSNVNNLFQIVAERVLYVRERAKNKGINGEGGIPVTPGASVDENGYVIKSNMNDIGNNTSNGNYHDERFTPARKRLSSNGDLYETSSLLDQPHYHGNTNGHNSERPPNKNFETNEIEEAEAISQGMCGSQFLACGASSDVKDSGEGGGSCIIL